MSLRGVLARQYRALERTCRYYATESALPAYTARGHYYSPLPEIDEGALHAAGRPECDPRQDLPGLELNVASQHQLLLRMCEQYQEFDWPERQTAGRRFYLGQGYYSYGDSICLYSMLRLFRPRRVIEVGSGFSSALMLDVNERFFDARTDLTFIEPFPDRLDAILLPRDHQPSVRILRQPVQSVASQVFKELGDGDFLFIDSSHVAKAASDVNHLFCEVVPRLNVGVFVHIHDIFWPFEYPAEWIRKGQAWNEAYVLRAFLSFNRSFEVVFWTPYAARMWPDIIQQRMPAYALDTGGSLWLRRVS